MKDKQLLLLEEFYPRKSLKELVLIDALYCIGNAYKIKVDLIKETTFLFKCEFSYKRKYKTSICN